MKNQTYGMFTSEGNYMVGRIVEAAQGLIKLDGDELNAWQFAYRELQKLEKGSFMKDGVENTFGEATDTDVREQVYEAIVQKQFEVPFYI
jgi:NADH pyrophosphatase NudC (nudix superfamily)